MASQYTWVGNAPPQWDTVRALTLACKLALGNPSQPPLPRWVHQKAAARPLHRCLLEATFSPLHPRTVTHRPERARGMVTWLTIDDHVLDMWWSRTNHKMAAWRQAISKNIREIRIHLCQTSPGSQGVRSVPYLLKSFPACACTCGLNLHFMTTHSIIDIETYVMCSLCYILRPLTTVQSNIDVNSAPKEHCCVYTLLLTFTEFKASYVPHHWT